MLVKESEIDYRIPRKVISIRKITQYYFPVCPKCNSTIPREYQAYCDRCGQALKWKGFSFSKKEKKSLAIINNESINQSVK